jgi:membrane protein DedA with SNARE-associated domain
VWSVALTLVGYYLGEAWTTFSDQVSSAFSIVSVVIIAAVIGIVCLWYVKRKKKNSQKKNSQG